MGAINTKNKTKSITPIFLFSNDKTHKLQGTPVKMDNNKNNNNKQLKWNTATRFDSI